MQIYTKEDKERLIKKHSPKSPIVKDMLLAFLFGGMITALGEALRYLYLYLGAKTEDAPVYVSVTVIFIGAALTLLGVFDKIAKYAGAGTLVPITGFSNAITSQAIDAKSEGVILGIGSKIFTVSGPVILFGISAGVLYGIIYFSVTEIMKIL